MILIDVSVPALDLHCDIRTDEKSVPSVLIEEILDLLRQETGEEFTAEQGFTLFSRELGKALETDYPLFTQGITDGSQLILV